MCGRLAVAVAASASAAATVAWVIATRRRAYRTDSRACLSSSTSRGLADLRAEASRPSATRSPPSQPKVLTSAGPSAIDRFRKKVRLVMAIRAMLRHDDDIRWNEEHSDPPHVMREAVVIVMVGLPARGKSFISNSLLRYLRVLGVDARCFNAGKLRRASGERGASADFFLASNTQAKAERDRLAMQCVDDMLDWIYSVYSDTTSVAILDATNTTKARRQAVVERCRSAAVQAASVPGSNPPPLRIVFLESICNKPDMLEANYRMKMHNDDYKDAKDADAALSDFMKRVSAYVEQYEPLEDDEVTMSSGTLASDYLTRCGLVRMVNGGQKLELCNLGSSMVMLNISMLLSCFHLMPRRLLFVPEDSVDATEVAALLRDAEAEDEEGRPVDVICSASSRSVDLARQIEMMVPRSAVRPNASTIEGSFQPRAIFSLCNMNPLGGCSRGVCPESGSSHSAHGDASPGSECSGSQFRRETFMALVQRLKDVILTIERLPRSLIVLCPTEEVLRVLLAHFHGCPADMRPWNMVLPRGPIIELQRDHAGFAWRSVPVPSIARIGGA